jgi:DNA polymerase-3 subunit alpha
MAVQFGMAIRLEGTRRSMGKHASGIIVCSEPLADVAPMVWDKSSKEMMVGLDHRDAEDMGLVKFDILGLRTLQCLQDAETIIRTGRV